MATRFWLSLSLSALITAPVAAQSVQSVLQTTAIAMGMENLSSIEYSGTGWQGRVGQNVAPDRDWPRIELTAYTRAIDFEAMSSKEEFVREGSTRQFTNLLSGDYAWTLDTQGEPVPQPAAAEPEVRGTQDRQKRQRVGLQLHELHRQLQHNGGVVPVDSARVPAFITRHPHELAKCQARLDRGLVLERRVAVHQRARSLPSSMRNAILAVRPVRNDIVGTLGRMLEECNRC